MAVKITMEQVLVRVPRETQEFMAAAIIGEFLVRMSWPDEEMRRIAREMDKKISEAFLFGNEVTDGQEDARIRPVGLS